MKYYKSMLLDISAYIFTINDLFQHCMQKVRKNNKLIQNFEFQNKPIRSITETTIVIWISTQPIRNY